MVVENTVDLRGENIGVRLVDGSIAVVLEGGNFVELVGASTGKRKPPRLASGALIRLQVMLNVVLGKMIDCFAAPTLPGRAKTSADRGFASGGFQR